jgi:glycerophosphoryl diester phosphodiesterase
VSHRGAPLQYPEHTREGYFAAAHMGAGWMECDVTFTKDLELVCRHSQCDLHTTTDVLLTPLASKCTRAFVGASEDGRRKADALCCTSDFLLEEFRTLRGKMDSFDANARTPEEYTGGTKAWRTDLHGGRGTLVTHKESIRLFQAFGARFIPELKFPSVDMPFRGLTQEALAQKLIDEYVDAGVDLRDVRPQSKHQPDVMYWLRAAVDATPVLLDERNDLRTLDEKPVEEWEGDSFEALHAAGLRIIAPPIWMLVTTQGREIVPSKYARAARAAGLDIVTWTLERSGPVSPAMDKDETYYQSVREAIYGDGTTFELLHVLARDVGVVGVFSDWPATVSLYAACFGL